MVDGVELLLTWVGADWQRSGGGLSSGVSGVSGVTSGKTSGSTSSESGATTVRGVTGRDESVFRSDF